MTFVFAQSESKREKNWAIQRIEKDREIEIEKVEKEKEKEKKVCTELKPD